jgi:serine protease inhibitor ecotin
MEKLSEFPKTLTPAGWTGKRTTLSGEPIVDEAGNNYDFSCHKIINKTSQFVVLYGQLNESTTLQKWGQRRYVIITVNNEMATMEYLGGPRNFS